MVVKSKLKASRERRKPVGYSREQLKMREMKEKLESFEKRVKELESTIEMMKEDIRAVKRKTSRICTF